MERVQTMLRALERLIATDPEHGVFGAARPFGHGYERKPVRTPAELAVVEANLGVLPDELRTFLTEVHGGGVGPGYGFFVSKDKPPLARRRAPFPFDTASAQACLPCASW